MIPLARKVYRQLFRRGSGGTAARLPVRPLRELISYAGEVRLTEAAGLNGNVNGEELVALCALVRDRACRSVFEIGTFDGRTTLNLALNLPDDGHVVTLDLPAESADATKFAVEANDRQYIAKPASGARFLGRPEASRIQQVFGDSGTFDFAPFAGQLDFVFVDGAHSYEYVLNDSRVALKLLRGGRGAIVWHDYGTPFWPGVTRAMDELLDDPAFGGLCKIEDTRLAVLLRP